jgi:hypothetical protein
MSARWMFSTKTQDVIDGINSRLSACTQNELESLINLSESENSSLSINTLTSQFEVDAGSTVLGITRFFISQYIPIMLLRYTTQIDRRKTIIKSMYSAAANTKIPALLGYAFEMDFIYRCHDSDNVDTKSDQADPKWTPLLLNEKRYKSESNKYNELKLNYGPNVSRNLAEIVDISDEDFTSIVLNGKWIEPKNRMQGGYDMSRVEKGTKQNEYHVHFYQITVAKCHALKSLYLSKHCAEILKLLKKENPDNCIGSISINFVVPKDRIENSKKLFSISNINNFLFIYLFVF